MLVVIIEQNPPPVHPLSRGWFHCTPIHTILLERFGVFPGKAYMLEIAAIVFIVITVPLWLPLVISVLSFGFEEGTDGHATCIMELQIAEEALAQARELAEETQNEINQRFNEIEDARERAVAIGAAQQQTATPAPQTLSETDAKVYTRDDNSSHESVVNNESITY